MPSSAKIRRAIGAAIQDEPNQGHAPRRRTAPSTAVSPWLDRLPRWTQRHAAPKTPSKPTRASGPKETPPLFRLSTELIQEIINHLDPESIGNAMLASDQLKYSFIEHPKHKQLVEAANQSAASLQEYLRQPAGPLRGYPALDSVRMYRTLFRKYGAFVSKSDAKKIILLSLREDNISESIGVQAIGAILNVHPEMADKAARHISRLQTKSPYEDERRTNKWTRIIRLHANFSSGNKYRSDQWTRAVYISGILKAIGPDAEAQAYTPFINLLKSKRCDVDTFVAGQLAQALPQLPPTVRDSVAALLLDREPANPPAHSHTFELFCQLPHLSAGMQARVLSNARATYNAMSRDHQIAMARFFAVNRQFNKFPEDSLPDSVKNEWRALLPEFSPESEPNAGTAEPALDPRTARQIGPSRAEGALSRTAPDDMGSSQAPGPDEASANTTSRLRRLFTLPR